MKRSAQFLAAIDAYDDDHAKQALRLMEECAQQGDPVACYMTALWYGNGEGVPADVVARDSWMQRLKTLAEQGHVEAQWELSGKYRWGNLLPLNIKQANFWLERAAEGGYGEAQHHLAWYFETGQYDYRVDHDAAKMWYQRAFDQEHPETLYMFAVKQFSDGKPAEEAVRLLRKAADKGFKQAEEVLRLYVY
jgi:TPR repeat protein